MDKDYKNLLERTIRVQESNTQVSNALLQVSKDLKDNMKSINDTFVLHNRDHVGIKNDLEVIKATLFKYLKWSIVLLLLAVGGASLFKVATDMGLLNFQ